ncbi:AbrB/MazE/SpoVT family DNA-binding domain-containing protein [Roseateles chitosanitabidus]|uniref:AbrB/MazE/SpoVT family DNA-binding domain-containing protein n=1 Tax=Roseateles chitosanitabidus TaxID=65048 RepID=UPI002355E9FB|nr:hypothetical protein [Roseateles chitosanitabidus]
MLAKLTSKNQLTLPKSVTDRLGPVQYFEVQLQAGQVLLTPVRIQRGDAVRAKLAELDLGEDVIARALDAARKPVKQATKQATKQAAGKAARSVSGKASPVKTRTPATAGVALVDKSVQKRVGKAVDKKLAAARKPAGKAAASVSAKLSTAAEKPARKTPAKTSRRKGASAA